MSDGLITPGLVLEVAEATEDLVISPQEFTDIMGTIGSIFIAAFAFGMVGMLIKSVTKEI